MQLQDKATYNRYRRAQRNHKGFRFASSKFVLRGSETGGALDMKKFWNKQVKPLARKAGHELVNYGVGRAAGVFGLTQAQ